MKARAARHSLMYSMIFLISSCVTINIYFPAAAVEKAADKIVDEVWGEEGEVDEERKEETEGVPQSLLEKSFHFIASAVGPEEAFAEEADINVTTPAIRALKDSIQKRASSIKPFMEKGNAGISNEGLLDIRGTRGLNLKEKARLKRLIDAENKDREALYLAIAEANNFSPDKVTDIKKIFAGSWIKNAKKGWKVQGPEGDWRNK